jgi:hypothetical protein
LGAFYHPQFLRDKPALSFLIGRRKDTKNKSEEQGTAEAGDQHGRTTALSTSNVPEHETSLKNMVNSPFPALVSRGRANLRMDRKGDDVPLNQLLLSNAAGGQTQHMAGSCKTQPLQDLEEAAIAGGLLFYDDYPLDAGISKIPAQVVLQLASKPQHQEDWFASISHFFEHDSFEDDTTFGVDFEPRPIEEMEGLSYDLDPNRNQR